MKTYEERKKELRELVGDITPSKYKFGVVHPKFKKRKNILITDKSDAPVKKFSCKICREKIWWMEKNNKWFPIDSNGKHFCKRNFLQEKLERKIKEFEKPFRNMK